MPTFIKFAYRSQYEAKNRAIAVALATANYLKGKHHFVHLFTADMLSAKPENCLKRINLMQKVNDDCCVTKEGEEFTASLLDLYPH